MVEFEQLLLVNAMNDIFSARLKNFHGACSPLLHTPSQDMANPRSYLPASVSKTSIYALLESLSIAIPASITLLSTSAASHIIYVLSYSTPTGASFLPNLPPNSYPTALILRIAGLHFPGIKTCNECVILKWLAA
jgi:hypothetical protein